MKGRYPEILGKAVPITAPAAGAVSWLEGCPPCLKPGTVLEQPGQLEPLILPDAEFSLWPGQPGITREIGGFWLETRCHFFSSDGLDSHPAG